MKYCGVLNFLISLGLFKNTFTLNIYKIHWSKMINKKIYLQLYRVKYTNDFICHTVTSFTDF